MAKKKAKDKDDIDWMFCSKCKRTVVLNESELCLSCQGKYSHRDQPDSWENMHICKKCGQFFPFISEGCVECKQKGEVMINDDILLCAFRYILGGSSHYVCDMTQHLIEWWPSIGEKTQDMIAEEIVEALNECRAGDDVDQEMWLDVLKNIDKEYLERVNKNCSGKKRWFSQPDEKY